MTIAIKIICMLVINNGIVRRLIKTRHKCALSMILLIIIIGTIVVNKNNNMKTIDVDICKTIPVTENVTEDFSSINILYHRITGTKIPGIEAQGYNIVCVTNDSYVYPRDKLYIVALKDNTIYYEKENK